ncbi:MAG: hypothetical protein DHS20C17_34020 [Cyclobacteriaceae bacterium]|nr:MAG: hypothetical protein DHS20C17_34020 [Cyclobacteriaceae bacterium]
MKLLAFLLALTVAGFNGYSATSNPSVEFEIQQEKKQIDKEELPENITEEFNKSVYKEWAIDKVYMLEASNEVTYELHLTQNGETMILLADSQGVLQPKADS